jgi:hypothetical protein
MNKRNVLITNLGRYPAPALPRFQRALNSTKPWYFLKIIFFGTPVTFLFWHTYFVVILTLDGESIRAARRLLQEQSNYNGRW